MQEEYFNERIKDLEQEKIVEQKSNAGHQTNKIGDKDDADDILSRLHGLNEQAYVIGEIAACDDASEQVELVS